MWQCVQGSQQRWCVWYLWPGCGWSQPPSPGRGPTANWQTLALRWSSTATARWGCTWEAVGWPMQASTPAPSPVLVIPSPARHASIWPTVRSTAIPTATPCSGSLVGGGLVCNGLKVEICAPKWNTGNYYSALSGSHCMCVFRLASYIFLMFAKCVDI